MRLDATTSLPDGRRVRLRLPQPADRARIADLLARLGLQVDELELARALRFDPRARTVVCATIFTDGHEVLVAWAAGNRGAPDAELVLGDEQRAPGVTDLARAALTAHARAAA